MVWEWLYTDQSTKKFETDGDLYKLHNGMTGTIYAYSSVSCNSTTWFKVKFSDTSSFGCGGFGIMSMSDPMFDTGKFNTQGHPMVCLCCTGTWGTHSVQQKGGQAMQYRLKTAEEKVMSFEINFEEMLYKVYDCNNELFSDYDMNKMQYTSDVVLVFYSGSG
eukprot:CAMPEP_0170522844 /NCGR_PEP_ID=MMETSP0209-20121228/8257_1 /TAXON_ID=665100 ORGANISM="Litonotus pictus, Strain P1" /NCGR_SAMPLE_ID=MMETSP0209 /ASSEMBLY_ACC=CAM_ASM_000301 /LENGTH=161 /DNA_ID=CAMNT_0010810557 /DNA_START=156 /DNA_END=637 /DNA_ORIENTATION=+